MCVNPRGVQQKPPLTLQEAVEEHTGTSQTQKATFPNCPQSFPEPGMFPPEVQLSLPALGRALTTPAQGWWLFVQAM